MPQLIYTSEMGSRSIDVFKTVDGKFEVICRIGSNLSRAFPVKKLKTRNGAIRRAHKFLNA